LGLNPIAQHEEEQRQVALGNVNVKKAVIAEPEEAKPVLGEKVATHVEGDAVISGLCPTSFKCPADHFHVYAESGSRKSKICLNGQDVSLAF